ncbi:MAG TPA: hypothetical protein VIY72_17415 [Acidimicrobiales bacterium]
MAGVASGTDPAGTAPATSGPGSTSGLGAVLLGAGAVSALLAAANLGLRWIDRGYDNTCTNVVQPSEWWSDDRCQPIMTYRLVGTIALLVCATVCLVALLRRWRSTATMVFAGVVTVASVTVVVLNELRWMGDQGWL